MKVIYGNDYKDAISNPPIEINDLKVFMQYKECYPYVEVLDEDEELEEEEYEGEEDNLDELLTTDPDSYQEPLIDNAVFYDNGDDDEDEEW